MGCSCVDPVRGARDGDDALQPVGSSRRPRPLTLRECARIASRLHPVHHLALWLKRVMGLRISEAFGVLVDDVIDDAGRWCEFKR